MSGEKVKVEFEINPDAKELLETVTKKYKLRDVSKAVRILIDYAATDGNLDEIFSKVRCRRCG
jgi:hypothetical protein